jgi:hypothetical protein
MEKQRFFFPLAKHRQMLAQFSRFPRTFTYYPTRTTPTISTPPTKKSKLCTFFTGTKRGARREPPQTTIVRTDDTANMLNKKRKKKNQRPS